AGILRRRRVPSKRPGVTSYRLIAAPEFAYDSLWNKIGLARIASHQLVGDPVNFMHRCEHPGMAGHPTHRIGVFIVDLPNRPSLANLAVAGCREHLAHRLEAARAIWRNI